MIDKLELEFNDNNVVNLKPCWGGLVSAPGEGFIAELVPHPLLVPMMKRWMTK